MNGRTNEGGASDDGARPVADLHVHTTASDGQLTVPEVPAAARAGGVDAVAVTDHDCVHPALDVPVTTRAGVTIVRGIELRVVAGEQELDLLGYAVDPTPALDDELARIQRNRVERARDIVERVESRLGVTLDVDLEPGVGRPHIARAVADSDADYDYQGAFDYLIGDDGPCYVAREIPTFDRGVDLLAASCSVVGLAHPLRYPDPEAAVKFAADLDAVERYYPYGRPVDAAETALVEETIAENDLLATGGSDAHDRTLGVAGPPRAAFERIAAHLPRA